jgi:small nuclear ribonucleoprotein (snRNP)-like protein
MNNLSEYINKLIQIKLRGRSEKLRGILKSVGKEWLLLEYNPVDFVLDGGVLINRKYLLKVERTKDEVFVEEVLKAKGAQVYIDENNLNLENTLELFKNLDNKQAIQIELGDESVVYIGRITKINNKSFRMKRLTPTGNWLDEVSYNYNSIRIIQIGGDYVDSLLAYMSFTNKI